ncbi:MAG: response regulator [Rhodospirillaceae bacterium]|nr:response regulator [Rhodospirillaceae bacterium]
MKRCLVIDDSRVIRRVAAKIVQDLGFAPEEAANGPDALAACKAAMPDVVLMEWDMTQMTGPDLARALRALPGGGAAKVVFCTSRNDPADIRAAIAAGADEYIMKPFDSDIVASKFLLLGLLG